MTTQSTHHVRRGRLVAASFTALMVLAACGSSDGAASDASDNAAVAVPDTVPATDPPATAAAPDTVPATTVAPAGVAVLENSPALTTIGAALPQLRDGVPDPTVGTAAPMVTGQRFDGTDMSIGGPSDGSTMLVFLAHWCPHCNDEIPELLELRDGGGIPADLRVIGISSAVASDRDNFPPSQWIDEQRWEWPVLADTESSEAFQTFGGSGFPFAVLLDADGNVLARKSGGSDAAQITSWLDASLPTT